MRLGQMRGRDRRQRGMGRGQRRRVVQARRRPSGRGGPCAFKSSMAAIFCAGVNPACHCVMPRLSRNRPDRLRPVAGQHDQIESARRERLATTAIGVGPQGLPDRDQCGTRPACAKSDAGGRVVALRIAGSTAGKAAKRQRCRAALPRRRSARGRPCPALRPRRDKALRSAARRASAAANGCRLDNASRAARSRSSGSIAEASTAGSGSVSVPVLSNTTVSISAMRSIASPQLRMMPDAEQLAGRDHLHRRNGKRDARRGR